MECIGCCIDGIKEKICDTCGMMAHKNCIDKWTKIEPGEIISRGKFACPMCRTQLSEKYIDSKIINILNEPGNFVSCIVCSKIKRVGDALCEDDETQFSMICPDCQSNVVKICPGCSVSTEKNGGCNHISCICGVHWCWTCEISMKEEEIYSHITVHSNEYQDYLDQFLHIVPGMTLSRVPKRFWTEELVLAAIRMDVRNYTAIQHKSMKFITKAVIANPKVIVFIPDQTEELALLAVSTCGFALQWVKSQTDKICREAVKKDPESIIYVQNQTEELQLLAVSLQGDVLQYIHPQPNSVRDAAVQNTQKAILHVDNQDEDFCINTLKLYPSSLYLMKDESITENVAKFALSKSIYNFPYIPTKTQAIYEIIVKLDPTRLSSVPNPSYDMCMDVVKRNGMMIYAVPVEHRTREMCITAIEQNSDAIHHINDLRMKCRMISYLIRKRLDM